MTTMTSDDQCSKAILELANALEHPVRGYDSGMKDYSIRLGNIESQVRGLQQMVEDDRWCPDIVTQISTVTRALQEVAMKLLGDHLDCCVVKAVRRSAKDGTRAIEEVTGTIRQVVRL